MNLLKKKPWQLLQTPIVKHGILRETIFYSSTRHYIVESAITKKLNETCNYDGAYCSVTEILEDTE